MRQRAKNRPTWPQEPSKGRGGKRNGGLRVGLSGFLKDHLKSKLFFLFNHAEGEPPRIVTLRGSARGSILENLPQQSQIMLSIFKICSRRSQRDPNPPKFLLELPLISPTFFPKRPKLIQKLSWSSCWANANAFQNLSTTCTSRSSVVPRWEGLPRIVTHRGSVVPGFLPSLFVWVSLKFPLFGQGISAGKEK